MAYLPVVSTGVEVDGITTLIWGTGGALQNPLPGAGFAGESYYTVENIEESQKAEQVYGMNGSAIESWRALLVHGKRWNITVQDDTTMAPPAVGTTVTVIDYLGNKTVSYVAKVISNDYRIAQKQAGQRILQVESLVLVDAQP